MPVKPDAATVLLSQIGVNAGYFTHQACRCTSLPTELISTIREGTKTHIEKSPECVTPRINGSANLLCGDFAFTLGDNLLQDHHSNP